MKIFLKIAGSLMMGSLFSISLYADRIYILPGADYNEASPSIIDSIRSLGHTVDVASPASGSLPLGFTSACTDPVNGYHWLCFFGRRDYSNLSTDVKVFIDEGGKVFYQYEVGCCVPATDGAAAMASDFTGLNISPFISNYLCLVFTPNVPGWEATNIANCVTMRGNAYKGMDGVPVQNQLKVTATLNGASPSHIACDNFGMFFSANDFTGTAHKGAFCAIGDINTWFAGGEPPFNAGSSPVDMNVVNFFFPNSNSSCYLFPPGCLMALGEVSLSRTDSARIYFESSTHQLVIENTVPHTTITVFNALGQSIYFSRQIFSGKITVSTETFNTGIYTIRVEGNTTFVTRKIIIP